MICVCSYLIFDLCFSGFWFAIPLLMIILLDDDNNVIDDTTIIVTKGGMIMSHKFNTFGFLNCHGKSPRGEGCYIFSIKTGRGKPILCYAPYGTFADAKKYAKDFFKDHPNAEIYVMP
jgi:hypothetical protein